MYVRLEMMTNPSIHSAEAIRSIFLNFNHDFPRSQVVKLTENYRSSHEIVATANRLIKQKPEPDGEKDEGTAWFRKSTCFILSLWWRIGSDDDRIRYPRENIEGSKPWGLCSIVQDTRCPGAIFERLAASNLPFVIEKDADSFYQRKVIRGMLAFMRLSLFPHDSKAASEVLSSLFLKQSILQELKKQWQYCRIVTSSMHLLLLRLDMLFKNEN